MNDNMVTERTIFGGWNGESVRASVHGVFHLGIWA